MKIFGFDIKPENKYIPEKKIIAQDPILGNLIMTQQEFDDTYNKEQKKE